MLLKLLALSLALIQQDVVTTNSDSLTARALELLQKNEKSKALKLLEQAFEKTQDSTELKQISALILEASPLNYPKREGYLKYLVKFDLENENAWAWYKELGDRAFQAGKMSEAEDFYLRAMPSAKDKNLVRYKLAWVQWNMKNRVSALQGFVEVLPSGDPGMQSQLVREIPKLWWEIGPLSADVFENVLSLPENLLSQVLTNLVEKSIDHEATTLDEALLQQLKSDGRTKIYLAKANNLFSKDPCFFFRSLLNPEDSVPAEKLLACVKSPKRPPAEKMISFFERYTGEQNEKLEWARAELLIELNRTVDAATQSLQVFQLENHSKQYIHFVSQLCLKLSESDFRTILQITGAEPFETLLKAEANPLLLEHLQAVDAPTWIAFEEKLFNNRSPSQTFLLKKGFWTSQRTDLSEEEKATALSEIFQKLIEKPGKSETMAKKNYEKLSHLTETALPPTFSNAFKKKYDNWLSEMDQSLTNLQNFSGEWQAIARPIYFKEVKKSIDSLIAQLDAATLDPELSALSETFSQKKEELKSDLRKKYLDGHY